MQTLEPVPRWRTITFYTVAGLVLAMILLLLWPLLLGIVLAWFPVDTWQSVLGSEDLDAGSVVHRIHFLTESLVFWGLTFGVGLQLWRPAKRQAPMLMALAVAVSVAPPSLPLYRQPWKHFDRPSSTGVLAISS